MMHFITNQLKKISTGASDFPESNQ